MLALYRSGRQAEALHVYQDARRVLSDELGLEPEQELRDLETAILRQHVVLSAGAPNATEAATSGPSMPAIPVDELRLVTALIADWWARRRPESAFLRTRSRRYSTSA